MNTGALAGTIQAQIEGRGHTLDRRDARLDTVWLMQRAASTPDLSAASARSTACLLKDNATAMAPSPDQPTLVILSDAVSAAGESAAAAIRAGGRVYGLVPTGWGEDSSPPEWLRLAASTSVLFRHIQQLPAAAVLNGDRGWLWTGAHGLDWRLALDREQVAAARHIFLDLFWNHAEDEGWPANGRITWRPRGEAPFDLPLLPDRAPIRLGSDAAPLPAPGLEGMMFAPDGQLPDGGVGRLFVPPSGERHRELATLVRGATRVLWNDLGLPPCVTGSEAAMAPSNSRWSLRILLSAEQERALADQLQQEPSAEFRTDISLGEAQSRLGSDGLVWRASKEQPEALIPEQNLTAGTVQADSLRGLWDAEPSSWPEPEPLALSVHWRWRVSAPRIPRTAGDDPLVKSWREADGDYAARTKAALASLAHIESTEGTLGKAFDRLKGPLLGFGRTRSSLRARLQQLSAEMPSALGPEATAVRLAQLAQVEAQVDDLREELERAERQAREQAERERQERAHAEAREKAEKELRARTQEAKEKQQRLDEVETELGKLASGTEQLSQREQKDQRIRRNKLRDEQNRLQKQVRNQEHAIEGLRKAIEAPFVFQPPTARPAAGKRVAGSFIPQPESASARAFPQVGLPAVGRLMRADGERLLAIGRWEELELGEAEALRLDARLVADTEE